VPYLSTLEVSHYKAQYKSTDILLYLLWEINEAGFHRPSTRTEVVEKRQLDSITKQGGYYEL